VLLRPLSWITTLISTIPNVTASSQCSSEKRSPKRNITPAARYASATDPTSSSSSLPTGWGSASHTSTSVAPAA
jgi:hypothetical protein